ncbi:condensation domain-containing protein [Streptomyces sp. NPDC101116]|uniref:condensation domain-containing protein n=1 Tax=Streptomyces sp. NPDC101116 TaxID=3366107 RepID=UPI00382FD662
MIETVRVAMTPAQESIWLEELLKPAGGGNAGFFSVLIRGEFDEAQVRSACLAVCDDSPQLRGVVVPGEQRHHIEIGPAATRFSFETCRVTAAEGEELRVAREWYLRGHGGSWDLTTRAPIRFFLLDHGGSRASLVIGVHHIAFDGRSKFVFARRFAHALTALRAGRTITSRRPDRPSVPRPDIAERVSEAVRHWVDAGLADLPGLGLPLGHGRDAAGEVTATGTFHAPDQACTRLADLTKGEGTSFFTGLVACAAARLHQYGNSRFVLGIPVDTSTPDTRDEIGLQVNVVPCLIDVPPGASFRDLVAICGRALQTVRRHRHVPFAWVLRELRRQYGVDVGRTVFDKVGISYPTVVREHTEVPGLTMEWDFFAPNSTQTFELILQLRREGHRVYGRLDYSTRLLGRAAAEGFADGFVRLLDDLTEAPDKPLPREPKRCTPALRPETAARGALATPWPEEPVAVTGFRALTRLAEQPGERSAAERRVVCPLEQFQPTSAVAAFVRSGGQVILEATDPVLGRLGSARWDPDAAADIPLTDPAPGLRFLVTTDQGFPVPRGVPGALGVLGGSGPGRFRAWIDERDHVRLLGTVEQVRSHYGRFLDLDLAEARTAALPGVREVAVLFGTVSSKAAPRVVLVSTTDTSADERHWLRAVRRVWPRNWPRPARVTLAEELPRLPSGEVDRSALDDA